MAFTNPIVQGSELKRTDVRSDNFVAGTSGWILQRNGGSEFGSLQVRNILNVGAGITLGGVDLTSIIERKALGCVAWINGSPTTSTTTEAGILWTEVDVVAGRLYEVTLMGVTPTAGTDNQVEFVVRFVTGTASWPNNSSSVLASTFLLRKFEIGFIRVFYLANVSTRLRLRASIRSADGVNAACGTLGSGGTLAVNDLGIAAQQNGAVGNIPPGKTLKEWTFSTTTAARYKGDGNLDSGIALPSNYVIQGNWSDGKGNLRSWMTFDSTALTNIADLVGVPAADILVAEAYFDYFSWWNGNGIAALGYHNKTSLGSVEPSGGVPGKVFANYTSTGGLWFDLRSGGFGSGSLMEALFNGYFKGFMIGNVGGNNTTYSGAASHNSSVRPAIHVKYYK